MRIRCLLLAVCLQACSSSAPAQPDAPESASAAEDGAPASASAAASPPKGAASPGKTTAASVGTADEVLRAVLTHAHFAEYLHPTVAGRVPVVVSGAARPTDPVTLELHGKPVEVKPPGDVAAGQPFIDVTEWSVAKDRATVAFAYDIEGVVASFELAHDATKGWTVTKADVAEH